MPVLGPRPRPGAPWPAGPGGRVGGQGDPQAAEGGRLRQLGRPRQQPPRTDPAPANNRLRPQRSGSYRRRHVRPGPGAGWEMESTRRPHAHQHAGSWRQQLVLTGWRGGVSAAAVPRRASLAPLQLFEEGRHSATHFQ